MSLGPAALMVLATAVATALALFVPRALGARVGRRAGVTGIGPTAPARWQQVRSLVMDPMRSLTTGHLVVIEVSALDPDHERNVRWFAGALAHSYDDPVGRALAKLSGQGRLSNVSHEPGLGVRGVVDRHPVRVGDAQWLGLAPDWMPVVPEAGDTMLGTTVAVEVDQRLLGRITVAEEVRRDASQQLDHLRRLGVTPVLASPAPDRVVARVAGLASSNVWHAETHPHHLAEDLAVAGPPVGVVTPTATGATLELVTAEGPTPLPTDTITVTSAGVDCVAQALIVTQRMVSGRRRGLWLTGVLSLLLTPLALIGLLSPMVTAVAAALLCLGTLAAACWGFAGIAPGTETDA